MERWEAEFVVPAEAGTSQPGVGGDCHSERSATEPRNLSGVGPAVHERSPRDVSTSLNMTSEGAAALLKGCEVPASAGTTGAEGCEVPASAGTTEATGEPPDMNSEAPVPAGTTDLYLPSPSGRGSASSMRGGEGGLDPNAPVYMGVDVARFGFDKSALCVRQGERVLSMRSFDRMDTMRLVHEVLGTVRETGAEAVFVDEGGVGGGVVDRLRELGAPVYGVHFGGGARRPTRFFNRRSEIFWELRRLFDLQTIAIPARRGARWSVARAALRHIEFRPGASGGQAGDAQARHAVAGQGGRARARVPRPAVVRHLDGGGAVPARR